MNSSTILGIPGAIISYLAIIHYSEQWDLVGNWFATNAFAVCIAALVYFLATRLDVLENKRLDEPAPFDSPQSMPECFGNIKELFSEASSGANFWSIKVMDPDQGRITAFLKYSEIHGGGLSPMLQLNRMMVADITLTPVAENEQVLIPAYEMKNGQAVIGLTKLQLLWRVDSPLNRVQANEIQTFMTGSLKEAVGLKWSDKPKPRSLFMPPDWLLIVLVISAIWCSECNEKYDKAKQSKLYLQQRP